MKQFLYIVILCVGAVSAWAVPARREGSVRLLPDGSEIRVFQHGDEYFHYMTNEAGEWIEEDEDGYFHVVEPLNEEQIAARRANSRYAVMQQRRVQAMTDETGASRLLSPRGLIILANFQDVQFKSTRDEMYEWAMGESYDYNGATGSVHQYFKKVSHGQYAPVFDVVGPVTVSRGYAYYGRDVGGEGYDAHADSLVIEACQLAANAGADFSQYDYNNDGFVDWVVVLYAGRGQADGGAASTIWPHQYDLSYYGKVIRLNNKKINHYCCLNEIDGQTKKRCGIGTFCHEFSHIMGLPDIYSTVTASHKTLGQWDLMDYGPYNNGGNTPPAYSAYESWWMGWIKPTQLKDPASVTMEYLHDGKGAAYITSSGASIDNILYPMPNVFYMLENRQKKSWDAYLPGSGLLITRIHFRYSSWISNTVNNSAASMGIDLLEADGVTPSRNQYNPNNGYYGKTTDAFPAGATEWTMPDNSSFTLTGIAIRGEQIIFDFNGGGDELLVGLEQTRAGDTPAQKMIRNGQVVIVRGGKVYDLMGRRIEN